MYILLIVNYALMIIPLAVLYEFYEAKEITARQAKFFSILSICFGIGVWLLLGLGAIAKIMLIKEKD